LILGFSISNPKNSRLNGSLSATSGSRSMQRHAVEPIFTIVDLLARVKFSSIVQEIDEKVRGRDLRSVLPVNHAVE
jgi:hypothetical protein